MFNLYRQPIQTIQPQSQCYFVGSKEEMQTLQPMPNTYYIGINRTAKEVYIKAWNNDGNIDFDIYTSKNTTEDGYNAILAKITSLEEKIDNVTDVHTTVNAKQSEYAGIQSDDGRKDSGTAVPNSVEHSKIKRNGY